MDSTLILGIATVFATFAGPVFAVQAQKWIETRRSLKDQKLKVFTALMATRAARLSPDHVQALNMIDLSFSGGSQSRSRTETEVLEAWRDYLDHLNTRLNENNIGRWQEKQNDLLIQLLSAMAMDLGLHYDRVLLRNGAYLPQGHTDIEMDQHKIRDLVIKVMSGEQALSMNVTKLPIDPTLAESQIALHAGLVGVLAGKASIGVRVEQGTNTMNESTMAEAADLPT